MIGAPPPVPNIKLFAADVREIFSKIIALA
jgi:hypothetical protein